MDSVVFNWSAKNGGTNTECSGELTVASLANFAKGLLTFHADKKGQQSKMVFNNEILETIKYKLYNEPMCKGHRHCL
jgi:hypothetical protein